VKNVVFSEKAQKIVEKIWPTLQESWGRAEERNLNQAYLLAFETCITFTIDEILKEKKKDVRK
jgi:hypothetical protein